MSREKRCRRMLQLVEDDSKDPEKETSIPKYRRVYQRFKGPISQPSSSGINILEDITIRQAEAPRTTTEVPIFLDHIEITPKRPKITHCPEQKPETFRSPSTNKLFQTLKNVEFSTPSVISHPKHFYYR